MKTILLTRSKEENSKLAAILKVPNFKIILCPLVKRTAVNFDINILNKYSHIVITSSYAAKILADKQYSNFRNLNFWLVGETSANILRQVGGKIEYIAKNVEELISLFSERLFAHTLYLAGSEITRDLPQQIDRLIIYNAAYTKKLTRTQIKHISIHLDYILLYSQNCAKALLDLLVRYDLLKKLENTVIVAISSKVAEIVKPFFKTVIYCQTNDGMLDLLFTHAKLRS